jgi:hypothetical protein
MSIKHQAIKKAMLERISAEDRDIPKYVQDKAEFFEKEKDYDTGYAFSTAWSIYCKYKNPNDKEHCTKSPSEYFTGKGKTAGGVKYKLMDSIQNEINKLESITGLSLDSSGMLFDMTQSFVMSSFNIKESISIKKYLKSMGVSDFLIKKYLEDIQFETQEYPF